MNLKTLGLIVGGLIVLCLAMIVSGASPVTALMTILKGSFGTPNAISGTLRETTPLLILGVGVFLALRAGLFNIGAEGQFLVGATIAAAIGLRIPGGFGMILGLILGALGGALWALPAGLIKAYRNGHEVISTIMLNNIAVLVTSALVAGPLKEAGQESPSTADLAVNSRMPMLMEHPISVNIALISGLFLAIGLAVWLRRTVSGYELEAVGANPTAATFAGIDAKRVIVNAMSLSGALGGLGGAIQVAAYERRFYSGISPGYGFDALGVALLAGGRAWGVIPSSLLFGVLSKGGTALQIDGIPKGITTVVLAILILIAAAIRNRAVKKVA